MIVGSADNRENRIATRSACPEAGSTATRPCTPVDLDRARISIVRDDLDTRDGASLEERDHRGPVVWGPIAEKDGDFAILSGRCGGGGAPQSPWRTVKEPLEDFVEASDAAES